MLSLVKKKVYGNRYIREMTIEPRALAPAAQIIIIIILVVPTTAQIQSLMPVLQVGPTTNRM